MSALLSHSNSRRSWSERRILVRVCLLAGRSGLMRYCQLLQRSMHELYALRAA